MNQKLNIAYIFSCIMDYKNDLTLPVASKKIKSFLTKSQEKIDNSERDEWKKIAISTFKNKQKIIQE